MLSLTPNYTSQRNKIVKAIANLSQKKFDNKLNEAQTRNFLINPMLAALGYDICDETQVIPEYPVIVGTKKDEKIDYALLFNSSPLVFVEAKKLKIDIKRAYGQLFRYFAASVKTKIGILTNGIDYNFYGDYNHSNILDDEPFFKFNILNYTKDELNKLMYFTKDNFDYVKVSSEFKGNFSACKNLFKGEKFSLTQNNISRLTIKLGWDTSANNDIDLDTSVFLIGDNGKVNKDSDFIYFNNASNENKSVIHSGDTTGGEDADEEIFIDFNNIPNYVSKIAVTVTIYEAELNNQSFKDLSISYLKLINADNKTKIAVFNLLDFTNETGVVVGEFYRHNNEWKLNAIGSGFNNGLDGLCKNYGLEVLD